MVTNRPEGGPSRPQMETPLHEIHTNRVLPASMESVLNSALSRGPGYELTPLGRRFHPPDVNGYYIDYSAKTRSPVASDARRLLPVALVQLALGWWERHLAGERAAADRFLATVSDLESRAEFSDGEMRWPQRAKVPKYGLFSPWCSALTQGQAASAFVRARLVTGDERYAPLARQAVAPLVVRTANDLVCHTGAGPILEEGPSSPPGHVLNGWISALWGIYDVARGLDDARAEECFEAGLACLKVHLPAYDTGWWSRYSLYPHPVEDLAKPIYHRFHIDQLIAMHRLTNAEEFAQTAARWQRYDGVIRTAGVLAQKAFFVASDLRRRRRVSALAHEASAPHLQR